MLAYLVATATGSSPRPSCSTRCGATASSASRRSTSRGQGRPARGRRRRRRPAGDPHRARPGLPVRGPSPSRGRHPTPALAGTTVRGRPADRPQPLDSLRQIRFCTAADGTRIAYATVGDGTAAGEGGQLDDPPRLRLGRARSGGTGSTAWPRAARLVRYDERGCGLSDWDVDGFGLDAWVDDLELVVDAAGLDRFPLLGLSQGGPSPSPTPCAIRIGSAGWCCAGALPPGAPGAGDHRRRAPRGRARHRAGPGRLGPRRPVVPPGVHVASSCPTAPASSGTSSTTLQRRTTSPRQRGAVPRGVRPARRQRPRRRGCAARR